MAEVEAKLAPHLQRVPALLHELAAREVQLEDSLRLHRERLRQVSENNQREVATQIAGTLASLHAEFEVARKDALAKWSEELEASGVRASHAAAESIGHTSEWLQQEARARLQALMEQSFVTAEAGLLQESTDAAQKFETQLASQSAAHLGQIRGQVEERCSRSDRAYAHGPGPRGRSCGGFLRPVAARGIGARDRAVRRLHCEHTPRTRGRI